MKAINKQDLINYLKKSPENLNFNIFGTMLDDFRNTYEADEQIVNKIKNIITNIIEDGGSISPEDDTITELVDLITELLPEKMIIKPVGTLEITENGTGIDVTEYASVDVNVETYEAVLTNLIERNITSIDIPSGVASVGDYAFYYISALLSAVIPDSVASIGEGAFYNCTSLTSIDLGNGVTSIGENAFRNCTGLLSVSIPDSVTTIGDNLLDGCTNLTTINIGSGLTQIGYSMFGSCTSLTDVILPDNILKINHYGFANCSSLTSIVIPVSVTEFGVEAFKFCNALTDIYYTGTQAQWEAITGLSGALIPAGATVHYEYTSE